MHGYDAAQIIGIHVFLHLTETTGIAATKSRGRVKVGRRLTRAFYLSKTSSLVLAATAMTSAMSLSSIFNSLSVA